MTLLNRLLHKPKKIFGWVFTSLIVASALYVIFEPSLFQITNGNNSSINNKKSKSISSKSKDVKELSKVKEELEIESLLKFLAKHQVFPDINHTSKDQLIQLVNQIK
ncbi:hypothetical protein WICMUC_002294 [Wickerhamomyces mucosus]|uniref:Uncharacterized protein n=1 Tax=Wickerhamomyces mucosus TaxID=1378264 RepID=A0A9P8PPP0_9ASCO|nr:hypothetical protein WICMUC_002294 [Wickerhamomyces mucosus]